MSDRYVLGVDGGGSKTIAWIARVAEPTTASPVSGLIVVGRGAAGPSNPRSVGFEDTYQNLELAISNARTDARLTNQPFASACLSLAGTGRVAEQEQVRRWADELRLSG